MSVSSLIYHQLGSLRLPFRPLKYFLDGQKFKINDEVVKEKSSEAEFINFQTIGESVSQPTETALTAG